MRLKKLTLLGLCALAPGLMAFGTSAAQAEPGNAWVVLDPVGTPHLVKKPLLPVLGAEIENTKVTLLATVLNGTVELEIVCTTTSLAGVHLEEEGKLTTGGKAKFTGCSVKINGEAYPECEVHSAGKPVGTVETGKFKGLLSLHKLASGGRDLVTAVEPEVGQVFVTLLMGEGCVIGEEVPVEGRLVFKDCELKATAHQEVHLVEEEPALTALTVLDDSNASIDGSALISLVDAEHVGLLWGAMGKEEEPQWLVANKEGKTKDAAELPATVNGSATSEELTLSATVAKVPTEVACTAINLVGVKLAKEGKLAAGAKARFSGCSIRIEKKAALECEVHSKGSLVGTIETNALKGEVLLNEGKAAVRIQPESGETLVALRLGEFCPLGEELTVKGTLYLKDSGEEATKQLVVHPFEKGPATALTLGGASATVEGTAAAFLIGEHLNRTWSAEPI